ncbi:SDR family NAD(P)-dependent oxidoreductase [Nostoc sp. PCC 9305]|uniref:SDR family NAD(P)-dependent oxidoreductase n=1 Tax=Nostoc sp. PCC 9305 TaxID=296636 RepID=UPI0039C7170D
MKLEGKKALITGGNSGIGFATARLFIHEGAEVAITGRDQKTLDAAVKELGLKAVAYRADVTDSNARADLFSKIGQRFGSLDIIFANAGIAGATPIGSADEAVFENIIRVNLTSVFFTVQAALPLLNDGSSIILNSSVIGSLGSPGRAAYAASKAGVRGMARAIASELSPRNIRVNVVAPGAIKTPIWSRGSTPPKKADELTEEWAAATPLGRLGEADEIAKAVLFLASDDSSYVQSVELFVDGGIVGSPIGGATFRSA